MNQHTRSTPPRGEAAPGVVPTSAAPQVVVPPQTPRDGQGQRDGHTVPRRRDRKLYVRVSEREKQKILEHATASHLSVSRYLARLGLEGRASAAPTAEERARRDQLLLLFRRTLQSVNRVYEEAAGLKIFEVLPGFEEDLDTALETLGETIRELARQA